jgi:hypothetical protein
MKRIFLIVLGVWLHASFLEAKEFKFTFGSKVGDIPLEISKKSENTRAIGKIKLNSWSLSPNYSSFLGVKKSSKFSKDKISKENIYIKFNIRF